MFTLFFADEPDSTKVVAVQANDGKSGDPMELSYTNYKVIGNGSFGVVFQAKLIESGDYAAIKKVLQDKRFKVWPLNNGGGLYNSNHHILTLIMPSSLES